MDVRHAAVIKFQSVSIKYLVPRVVRWKAIVDSLKKFVSNVGDDI
jgi:hypothetical protein